MIGMLRGHVESVDAVSAIIEVGGVGYEVRCHPPTCILPRRPETRI